MSSKLSKNVSLSERISNILTPRPHNSDDEDETQAKLFENIEEFSDSEDITTSSFRKHNAALLEDLDERYAGKKSSRKKLGTKEDDNSSSASDVDPSSMLEGDIKSDSEDESDSDEPSELDGENEDDKTVSLEEVDGFQHIDESKSKDSSKRKGQCVRNQLLIFEGLLEMRIQLQKCVVSANKLPQDVTFSNLVKNESEFSKKVTETSNTISGALTTLLEFQNAVTRQFPETRNIFKTSSVKTDEVDIDNEEIPSDTDLESESESDKKPAKRQKLDLTVELSKRHDQYIPYRNSVIQKWNDKTRLAVSKHSINNHSVVNQIEHNLSDRNRLIRKTQLKRSQYQIIGDSEQLASNNETKTDEETTSRVAEEYNSNIFDDDDFYHHLLRELIEVKSADLTDPVQLGRQWIQLQNLRSKMKRKIDTRATKGRKIRYAVHSKLVNFMAPIDDFMWTNEAKNELYSSLFGKK